MGNKLAIIMDPIEKIYFEKDTSLALLLEAQSRGWELFYLEQRNLYLKDGQAYGKSTPLRVYNNAHCWFELGELVDLPLEEYRVMLMRKDPPFDMEYIYTTYILEFAQQKGVKVVNDPRGLRDANEKLFAQWFPQCMPPTIVTKDGTILKEFVLTHGDVVFKPLHSMGGGSIFRLKVGDDNINVVIEILTANGTAHIMAQRFIPDIQAGDKRIFLVNGQPMPYALARIPAKGEIRGNLAAGGIAKGVELTQRDYWICQQVGETLKNRGLLFVGIDVIGDYLTEINVTSPTCVRELQAIFDIDICKHFFDLLDSYL